jgi:sugar phosphate isomerase/epimerase
MNVLFFCPRWGSESLSWDQFFSKAKKAGFDGVEIGFPFDLGEEEKADILSGLKTYNLSVIGQHGQTIEMDFEAHRTTFEKHLYSLAKLAPLFINSQTGKDYYTVEQNLLLMQTASAISQKTDVPIIHETHRGKWSFAAHITKDYLQQAPYIRLTLDLSHWCNVAESLLEDQAEAVKLAIKHADHLHARVGFQEGPQVMDPRTPENKVILEAHLVWWDAFVAHKKTIGAEKITITPEYGAPPYQHLLPYTGQPITDQWEINVWMKNLLQERYKNV